MTLPLFKRLICCLIVASIVTSCGKKDATTPTNQIDVSLLKGAFSLSEADMKNASTSRTVTLADGNIGILNFLYINFDTLISFDMGNSPFVYTTATANGVTTITFNQLQFKNAPIPFTIKALTANSMTLETTNVIYAGVTYTTVDQVYTR